MTDPRLAAATSPDSVLSQVPVRPLSRYELGQRTYDTKEQLLWTQGMCQFELAADHDYVERCHCYRARRKPAL